MGAGVQTDYNYNNRAYSPTGYPFSSGELKLQASYSTSVYDAENLQSTVFVAITLYNKGIDWGYRSGREVNIYWNGTLVNTFAPPSMHEVSGKMHTTTMGSTSFVVQHDSDGTCIGELKVEWQSTVLNYTIDGVTINVTELGCKMIASADTISGGTTPGDVFTINGKDFGSICQADGVTIKRAEVNKKSVVTINGTEWAKEKKRHTISVKIMDMSSDQYAEYAAYMKTNPANVVYKDDEDGLIKSGTFYILNITQTKKKVISGLTYLTGISFELSEVNAS